jgi:hypothetical protein
MNMGPHDRFEISRSFVPVDDPYMDAFEMGVERDAVKVTGDDIFVAFCCFLIFFLCCFFLYPFRFTVGNACSDVWW